MRIVEVEWLDAHATLDSCTIEEAEKTKPVITLTIAYLMAETDEGVTLATDRYPEEPKHGKIINHIPWEMIIKWDYLCEV